MTSWPLQQARGQAWSRPSIGGLLTVEEGGRRREEFHKVVEKYRRFIYRVAAWTRTAHRASMEVIRRRYETGRHRLGPPWVLTPH